MSSVGAIQQQVFHPLVPCGGALRRRKKQQRNGIYRWILMEINEWDPFWRCSNQHKFHSKFVFLFFFLLWCWIDQHRRKSRRVKSSIHLIIVAMIVDTQRAKKMIEDDDDATHLNSLFFFSFIFASSRWTPRTNPLRIIAVWMSSQLTNWCSTAVVVYLFDHHLRNIFR